MRAVRPFCVSGPAARGACAQVRQHVGRGSGALQPVQARAHPGAAAGGGHRHDLLAAEIVAQEAGDGGGVELGHAPDRGVPLLGPVFGDAGVDQEPPLVIGLELAPGAALVGLERARRGRSSPRVPSCSPSTRPSSMQMRMPSPAVGVAKLAESPTRITLPQTMRVSKATEGRMPECTIGSPSSLSL